MKEFRLMVSFKINSFYLTYSDSHEQKHDFRKDSIYNIFIKHKLSKEQIIKMDRIYLRKLSPVHKRTTNKQRVKLSLNDSVYERYEFSQYKFIKCNINKYSNTLTLFNDALISSSGKISMKVARKKVRGKNSD